MVAGSIFGSSSITITHFIPSGNKHGHNRQFLFLGGQFLISFSPETLSQVKRNFTGNIYGRSSIRFPAFIPIRQKRPRHLTLEIKATAWDRHTNMAGWNRLMQSQPFHFYNWISNGNTYQYINKRFKKPGQVRFYSIRPHTITKINDNIDSTTIVESMNARI